MRFLVDAGDGDSLFSEDLTTQETSPQDVCEDQFDWLQASAVTTEASSLAIVATKREVPTPDRALTRAKQSAVWSTESVD